MKTPELKIHPPIWKADPEHFRPEDLVRAAVVLKQGGVVLYPTETFYGLGGNPLAPGVLERIYGIKGRDFEKPLPLIASSLDAARKGTSEFPEIAEQLAALFWPGPLTLILCAASHLPALLHAGTSRIAIRVSSHPAARFLAQSAGGFLVSTSANSTGRQPPSRPGSIPVDLLDQTDGMVDCGDLPGGLPSTIVDVSAGRPRLVRIGAVEARNIEEALDIAFQAV